MTIYKDVNRSNDSAELVGRRTTPKGSLESFSTGHVQKCGMVSQKVDRVSPSLRVFISKENGGARPLGIASLEDKSLQSAVTDTTLAIICLHYVHDLWVHRRCHKRVAKGNMIIVRFADVLVVGFQHRQKAEQFLVDLKKRLVHFQLELHSDKTLLIEFERFTQIIRRKRALGKPKIFDFLCMTHYCEPTRKGNFRLESRLFNKRIRWTLRRIKEEVRQQMHGKMYRVVTWLGQDINDWLNDCTVLGSSQWLVRFAYKVKLLWMCTLRRRSQKNRTSWGKLESFVKLLWPKVTVRHPWPVQRQLVRRISGRVRPTINGIGVSAMRVPIVTVVCGPL